MHSSREDMEESEDMEDAGIWEAGGCGYCIGIDG